MTRNLSITVVGGGAVGSAVAFSLARAGFAPKVLTRGATLDAIRRDGLRVERPDGSITVRLEATDDPAALGPQDLVIGTMKGQDWPAAIATLTPLVGPETALLPTINGVPWWYFDAIPGPLAGHAIEAVDPGGRLLAAFPAQLVIGAVIYVGVTRAAPGVVDWSSGNRLVIGEAAGPARERTRKIGAVLRDSGFAVDVTDDIRREIWAKLLGNAVMNPLSVVARALVDEIMGDPGLGRIVLRAMHEVAAVAAAVGAPSAMDVETRYAINAELGAFRTSMLQDYEAGRALELGAIVEAVVEIGGKLGIVTPVIETIGVLARRAAALRDRQT